MNHSIEEKLKEIIVSVGNGNFEADDIHEDSDMVGDFAFGSVNIIQMVVEIENTFDIEIGDEDLELPKLAPYQSLLQIIQKKLEETEV